MQYKILGRTDLKVSVIGFGSTELGMDYGINVPGEYGKPDKATAKKIIYKALDSGINFFDTAPGYGDSELLLGEFLSGNYCYIATKISLDNSMQLKEKGIRLSVESSLKKLKREYLDIVQIQNTTFEILENHEILKELSSLRKDGLIKFIGASVYQLKEAMAVVRSDFFDLLQVAYNILDQRILDEVIPEAEKKKVGIISRSTYFRGMLTKKIMHLDENWEFLKGAVDKIKKEMNICDWDELPKLALKFCLSTKGIDNVLIGIRTIKELESAINIEQEERITEDIFNKLLDLKVTNEYWLNPLNWYRKL